MNKIKVLLLLAVLITGGQYLKVFGQTPAPTPFSCSELGQIVLVGNGNTGPPGTAKGAPHAGSTANDAAEGGTIFIRVNTSVNPCTADTLFTIPYAVNGTGYNPADGCLYSLPISTYTGAAAQGGISGITTLLRIDAKGVVTRYKLLAPSVLPPGGGTTDGYKSGTVDDKGILYLTAGGDDTHIYAVDLNPLASNPDPATFAALPTMVISLRNPNGTAATINIPDIVYNPLDYNFYGIESYDNGSGSRGKVLQLSNMSINEATLTGTATVTRFGDTNLTDYNFGAEYIVYNEAGTQSSLIAWSNTNGNFWLYPLYGTYSPRTQKSAGTNIGPLLKLGKGYDSQTWPAVTGNDGISCPGLNADLRVAKNDTLIGLPKGKSATYSVVVSNYGPANASGIHVTDSLPKGIPSANMTWQVVAKSSPSDSSLFKVGEIHTGMLEDIVKIQPGEKIIYAVTVTVPINYPNDILLNVANATPNNFVIDPDLTNNSDYDADSLNPPFLPVNHGVRVTLHKKW